MDESGIIVDESARRDEKELKRKREIAETSLRLQILQIEDEAQSCFDQAAGIEVGRRGSDFIWIGTLKKVLKEL